MSDVWNILNAIGISWDTCICKFHNNDTNENNAQIFYHCQKFTEVVILMNPTWVATRFNGG